MSKAVYSKLIKDLDWSKTFLTPVYNGAIHTYQTLEGSTVAVLFTAHKVMAFRDGQGDFTAKDIEQYIVKDKAIKHMTANITEAIVLAEAVPEDEFDGDDSLCEVAFNDENLKNLGIDTFEVRESLRVRMQALFAYAGALGAEIQG